MRILGISAFDRDAAAALLVDGTPVAACREADYTGRPGDPGFPTRAIRACLDHAGIQARELDTVVFAAKPLRAFERVLAMQVQAFPRSARSFGSTMVQWLGDRLWVKNHIIKDLAVDPVRVSFIEHHLALAAQTFHASPFESAALLIIDDAAEWATTTLGRGDRGDRSGPGGTGARVELLGQLDFPHSLGLFAAAITQFLGLQPDRDEWLLEALAARGTPTLADQLRRLFSGEAGYFQLDQTLFRFAFDRDRLYADRLTELLGPPRFSGDPLRIDGDDRRHADIAASAQRMLEERVLALCDELRRRIECDNLCLSGSLATNRRLVTRVLAAGPFGQVSVPGSPTRAGAALGAALYANSMAAAGVGGGAGSAGSAEGAGVAHPQPIDLGEVIDDRGTSGARELRDSAGVVAELARRLASGERIAWVRGRLQFVDRGHTNRCILSTPVDALARHRLLAAVQRSEAYLPCCLLVPAERAGEYLELTARAARSLGGAHLQLPAREALLRDAPAAVDPDGSAWVSTVAAAQDPELHALLEAVGAATGVPLLLQADFALRGSTVVRDEYAAVQAFARSRLDALVIATRLFEQDSRVRM